MGWKLACTIQDKRIIDRPIDEMSISAFQHCFDDSNYCILVVVDTAENSSSNFHDNGALLIEFFLNCFSIMFIYQQTVTLEAIAEKARLDVSGIGVWGSYERSFLDVRIVHPNAPSYIDKPIEKVYETHEKEKKRMTHFKILVTIHFIYSEKILTSYVFMFEQ